MKDHRTDKEDAIKLTNVNTLDYLRSTTNIEVDKVEQVTRHMWLRIHNEFGDIFTGIRCFEVPPKLRLKEGSHPYLASSRKVAHVRLQKQQIIVPLDVDKTGSLGTALSYYWKLMARCNYAWIQQGSTGC